MQAWKKNGGDGQFLTGIQAERILVKEMRRKMEATRSEQRRHKTKTTIRGHLKVRETTTENREDNYRGLQASATTTQTKTTIRGHQ